jgi:hypothetical protein
MRAITSLKSQAGLSIVNLIIGLVVIAFIGITAAKLVPAYNEWNSVRKIFNEMRETGDLGKSVREIRQSFDKRASVAYVEAIKGEDLEVGKNAGEVVVSVAYQRKIPLVANVSFCIDFVASTDPTVKGW